MITDITVVMPRLLPYIDILDGILRHGHDSYLQYPPSLTIDHDRSAQAHCTYRHIRAEALRAFQNDPSVRHFDIQGQNLWLIEPANALIRFKKTDQDGVSSNYPTRQAQDFEDGLDIPGLPPEPTRLTAGYFLDETGLGFVRSQISFPLRSGVLWCAAIVPKTDRAVGGSAWIDITRQPRFGLF